MSLSERAWLMIRTEFGLCGEQRFHARKRWSFYCYISMPRPVSRTQKKRSRNETYTTKQGRGREFSDGVPLIWDS